MKSKENKQEEEDITKLMMIIFRFENIPNSKKFIRCTLCGKRLMINYIGMGINERMIQHFNNYHKGV
jgi:hypothetical protein